MKYISIFAGEEKIFASPDEDSDSILLEWKSFNLEPDEIKPFLTDFCAMVESQGYKKILVDASVASGSFSESILVYAKNYLFPMVKHAGIQKAAVVIPIHLSVQQELNRWEALSGSLFEVQRFFVHAEARKWLNVDCCELSNSV